MADDKLGSQPRPAARADIDGESDLPRRAARDGAPLSDAPLEAVEPSSDNLAKPPRRRPAPRGPEVRETWVHRREKQIKVSLTWLDHLGRTSRDEILLFTGGQFFMSGAGWLAVDKYLSEGLTKDTVWLTLIALLGLLVAFVGWRKMSRRPEAVDKLLAEVDEEEER